MNILRKKRGVSEVISVVLIIMITVAAIAVLWSVVIPMIQKSIGTGSDCFQSESALTIVDDQYTCYKLHTNTSGSYGNVSVHFSKKESQVNVTGAQFVVQVGGNSYTTNVSIIDMGFNSERTILLSDIKYLGATGVSIAPIVTKGKTSQTCTASPVVVLTNCTA